MKQDIATSPTDRRAIALRSMLRRCVALVVLPLAVAQAAHAAQTAKAAIQQAAAAAAKWQTDAQLTHVSTLRGQRDGRAPSWLCTYYSPKAKKSAIVTVRDGGKIDVDADVRNTSIDAIGIDFVDSDQAVAAAIKAGLKFDKAAKDLGFGLVVGGQASGRPQLYWSVMVSHDKGMSGVTLNGKDAAFVKRDEVKY
ncbi:MAG: hypothetical protein HS128_02190 [Ideonella sp.]|nr:hypothetical protein [Ideonella sp.]MCC7458551.1 hypothetical protein [Nitrospira sp.]